VLWCLVRQAGQVVLKDTLLDTVLAVCIRQLRQALGDAPQQPRYIEPVHTRGYQFVASVEPLQTPRSELGGPPAARPRVAVVHIVAVAVIILHRESE
jgi:DNA-binding winged helix-turn-helix (wHTH) protein